MHWVKALRRVKLLGGSPEKTMNTWDKRELAACDQLKGKKKWAVANLLERSTSEFIDGALAHISKVGSYEQSCFTDTNLSTKAILLGEGPRCKADFWTKALRNSPESLALLIQVWTREGMARKDGNTKKRDPKEVGILAEWCAFCADRKSVV